MGFAVLAEVVRRVSGVPLAEFLRVEVFEPLGMPDTSLGARPGTHHRIAAVRLEPGQEPSDWTWNSRYWLDFGAPWGGLITSPVDLARLALAMLGVEGPSGFRPLGAATLVAMTRDELADLPNPSRRPWGLGWQLAWPGQFSHFGDLVGPRTFGHWGATGTVLWIDPDAGSFLVLLTTQPPGENGRHLARASNAFAAAF
jgi:CubicO group peptidase (beta-lactamase class C family)